MIRFKFKVDILLAILVPLLFTFIAITFFYGTPKQKPQEVESRPLSSDSTVVVMSVDGIEETVAQKAEPRQFMGPMQLGMALALVMSLASLFGYYYPSRALWYVAIILSLLFTVVGASYVGIKLTAFFIPNLLLVTALTLIAGKLFFNRNLIRFRMVICSILGAAAVALYYFLLAKITRYPSSFQDVKVWFVNSLVNLIFVTFGLSLAHMFIHRIRYKQQTAAADLPVDDDEDMQEL
ncbi:MAG TPA: hypothetical protein GX398_05480 [Candidatus Cloacimonetes bacterium]|nr:hypothetical protein [Candidatus Cloacimonadota bacterium]